MPDGVANCDIGTKTVGSRTPLHSDQSLCRREQGSEHVLTAHRGHVYFGSLMWHILQSVERSGSAMVCLM